ncbi:hypothetical protein PULV_b0921 [Pseudoalteromonas ulvae UL12]|uniref:hypothetical protein n=1 Tax=Pseudoalteromonas ulvae TaxID=107327 RepID=UPI00186B7D80|nr:hypothetical protein [Pseudoalteromonas ulvae]MBE0366170.1 hypothetical protein [Pseudoalteromonas ulvae UL12]
MDAILPFLPRIAYVTPLERRSIIVAGVQDAKIRKLSKELKQLDLKKKELTDDKSEIEQEDDEKGSQLDTWA